METSSVSVHNVAYVDSNMRMAPMASSTDGMCDLLIVRGEFGRTGLIKLFMAIDEGNYFNNETGDKIMHEFDTIKSTEWRIEPAVSGLSRGDDRPVDPHAIFSIDGERYPAQTITGKVLPGKLRIYC